MFIDLGNAMINTDSIEGIWKRDIIQDKDKLRRRPYKIVITLKGTDRTEELFFEKEQGRDSMYNVIRDKIIKGEKINGRL